MLQPYFSQIDFTLFNDDCLKTLKLIEDDSVDLVVTSPPYNNWRNKRTQAQRAEYWQRTNIVYDNFDDKMTDAEYQQNQIDVLNELYRVIKPTGTICYNHKDQIFNFEVTSPISWILQSKLKFRQRITWDRAGMQAYNPVRFYRCEEDIYILGKEAKNFKWNKEYAKYMSIWRVLPSKKEEDSHPAAFPLELPIRCIQSFTDVGDTVLDPYCGSGATLMAAKNLQRKGIGIEISNNYCEIIKKKLGAAVEAAPSSQEEIN